MKQATKSQLQLQQCVLSAVRESCLYYILEDLWRDQIDFTVKPDWNIVCCRVYTIYILGVRVGRLLAACYGIKTQNAVKTRSWFFKRFLTTQSSPAISQLCTASLPHLQEDGGPYQIEDGKQNIFIIVLPVKEVVGDADQSHWHQGKCEVLKKAKVERQAFAEVMPDSICIIKDTKPRTDQLSVATAGVQTLVQTFISEMFGCSNLFLSKQQKQNLNKERDDLRSSSSYSRSGWKDGLICLYQLEDSLFSSSLSWRGKHWTRIPLDCNLRTKQYLAGWLIHYHYSSNITGI